MIRKLYVILIMGAFLIGCTPGKAYTERGMSFPYNVVILDKCEYIRGGTPGDVLVHKGNCKNHGGGANDPP